MKNFQNKAKIIKVSTELRSLARLALAGWTLGLTMFLFVAFASLTHGGSTRSQYIACGGIAEMVLAMMVSLNFYRFFGRLQKGELFDGQTADHLAAAGRWWLAYWICDCAFAEAGNIWLGTTMALEFGHLFASMVVIFVAWLLREGQQLQEEQQLTV